MPPAKRTYAQVAQGDYEAALSASVDWFSFFLFCFFSALIYFIDLILLGIYSTGTTYKFIKRHQQQDSPWPGDGVMHHYAVDFMVRLWITPPIASKDHRFNRFLYRLVNIFRLTLTTIWHTVELMANVQASNINVVGLEVSAQSGYKLTFDLVKWLDWLGLSKRTHDALVIIKSVCVWIATTH